MPNTTSPGKKLRQAVEQNNPLQVVGTVNAYSAIMAEKSPTRNSMTTGIR